MGQKRQILGYSRKESSQRPSPLTELAYGPVGDAYRTFSAKWQDPVAINSQPPSSQIKVTEAIINFSHTRDSPHKSNCNRQTLQLNRGGGTRKVLL